MMPTRLSQILPTAALLAAALTLTPAQGQVQVQNGFAHDANQQVGSFGINGAGRQLDFRARNLLVTGNVGGGRAFQGDIGFGADGAFQGSLGSDTLFNFRRDSIGSAVRGGGGGFRSGAFNDRVVIARPGDSLAGFRSTSGSSLSTRTTFDPRSGVVTFQQSGGGLVAISGVNNPQRLRDAGTSLGLVQTPGGLVSVDASPLTGIRFNALDVNTPSLFQQPRLQTAPSNRATEELEEDNPLSLAPTTRFDGRVAATSLNDVQATQPDLTLRQDPLAITLGTQLQSQIALSLAGKQDPNEDNTNANTHAQNLRDRVFGKETQSAADANEPAKAPQSPYDKLIADILADAEKRNAQPGENAAADANAEETETESDWKQIFDSPDQAIIDAKLKAREAALRISLGLVDDEGNIDYETELPTIDADSELGKLIDDLSYDLPRVQTLAGQDPNRINKLLSRGEQELDAERYLVAENIYRQVLREKSDDPLAQAGLVHSQMGAGMIRSAAFNIRDLFADHPELIALKYDDNLLPNTDRLRWLQNRLQKMIGEDVHGADPGLILAYLGYQLDAKPLIEFGLNVAESEAPRDPLMPVVRKIWLEGKTPEAAGAGEAEGNGNDK